MNWGRGILVAMILFVGVIATMVYVSVNTEFSLVADNYYEQELAYDDQIARIRNFEALAAQPEFTFNRAEQQIKLQFSEELVSAIKEGKVVFFRASGAKHDKVFELNFDEDNVFTTDVSKFLIGAWSLQLSFTDGAKEYYKEIKFVI